MTKRDTHDWPAGRARHGGVDEIPLPEVPGRLWLCGKHFVGPDPEAALATCGADRIVCLCERPELELRYPRYVSWLDGENEDRALWFPVPDLHAPGAEKTRTLLDRLEAMIRQGHGVLMHCGAGIGRAGTMAVALLMHIGVPHGDALLVVSRARPTAGPEAGPQAELLEALAGQG